MFSVPDHLDNTLHRGHNSTRLQPDKVCIRNDDDEHCGVNLSTSIYCM